MAQGQNIENQPIASQYGVFKVPATQMGSYSFTPGSCQQAAGNRNFAAFSNGTPVKIVDASPALTEIVTPSTVYINDSQCVINVAPVNTHVPPFYLTSGTGGLQEALINSTNISGANTIVLDTLWHQLVGSSAASVIAAAKGSTTLGLVDITTTPYVWYQWNGSAYVAVSISGSGLPTASAAGQAPVSTGPGTTYTAQGILFSGGNYNSTQNTQTPTYFPSIGTILQVDGFPSGGGTARGAWSSATAYNRFDTVVSGGVTWIAVNGSTNITPAQAADGAAQFWAQFDSVGAGLSATQADCAFYWAWEQVQVHATGFGAYSSVGLHFGSRVGGYLKNGDWTMPTNAFGYSISLFGDGRGQTWIHQNVSTQAYMINSPNVNSSGGQTIEGITLDANILAGGCLSHHLRRSLINDVACWNPQQQPGGTIGAAMWLGSGADAYESKYSHLLVRGPTYNGIVAAYGTATVTAGAITAVSWTGTGTNLNLPVTAGPGLVAYFMGKGATSSSWKPCGTMPVVSAIALTGGSINTGTGVGGFTFSSAGATCGGTIYVRVQQAGTLNQAFYFNGSDTTADDIVTSGDFKQECEFTNGPNILTHEHPYCAAPYQIEATGGNQTHISPELDSPIQYGIYMGGTGGTVINGAMTEFNAGNEFGAGDFLVDAASGPITIESSGCYPSSPQNFGGYAKFTGTAVGPMTPSNFAPSSTSFISGAQQNCDGSGTLWGTYPVASAGISSSIFYIASNCGGLSNCLAWVDDDSTDNCGTATTTFMAAINSSTASTPYVYIQGGGSGKAYKLSSCNLAFTGPSGAGGLAGSPTIVSNAVIDCAQTGGNCIQMGKTGCSTSTFYGTGCHDVTWRGGTFIGGVGLSTALMEVEQGMYISVIDDVTFQNTGAGNATVGQCTNYSVQWDTFIGGQEFSRNKYWGNVLGQCFSHNIDATGGANTIVYTNNVISHDTLHSNCGSILHSDSSMHSTIDNNTLFGFAADLVLVQSASATQEGGWIVSGNNIDTAGCTIAGGQPAAVQFGYPSNNAGVGPVTFTNNNGYTSPMIAQYSGSSAQMQGWSITGNNTTVNSSALIGGGNTGCATFNGVPCYIGANPGYPTGTTGGTAYTGFTVLGSSANSTWPPSGAVPTFSPSAGAISSGTTVTTSCSGGSPYISTGTTAVAGGTGIAVSSPETLYGACQGSGYTTTGTAAYTISGSTFAVANNQFFHGSSSSVSSQALPSFSSSLTSGSLIIVHQYSTTVTYAVPTDTAGNTYVDCGPGEQQWGGGSLDMQCFYALNTHTTASNVVTLHTTGTSAQFFSGIAFEVTGAASSSPIDGGNGVGYSVFTAGGSAGGAAGANNLTAQALTPAGNGDLIVAFFASSSGNTQGTSPNAFTLVDGGWVQGSEYFTQATSASITATASSAASSDPYQVITIAVKP